ncbi:MAG: FG-GAP repeat domain-containing protein [Hyphomonadaceae bacterium]
MSVIAFDTEPTNNSPSTPQDGGLIAWPNALFSRLTISVQSRQVDSGIVQSVGYDPIDNFEIDVDPNMRFVKMLPDFNLVEFVGRMNEAGVFGAHAYLSFTPSGAFAGSAITVEAKTGFAQHGDALLTQAGAVADIYDTLTNASEQAYIETAFDIINSIFEQDGVNRIGTAVAATLQSFINGNPLFNGTQVDTLLASIVQIFNQWNNIYYYSSTHGVSPISVFDMREGIQWGVDPTHGPGEIGITGSLLLNIVSGEDVRQRAVPVSVDFSQISWGSGVLPANTTLAAGQDYDLAFTNADTPPAGTNIVNIDASALGANDSLNINAWPVGTYGVCGTGGSGQDTFAGGQLTEIFVGNAGIDSTFYFITSVNTTFSRAPNGNWTVTPTTGAPDQMNTVEFVTFNDRTLAFRPAEGTVDGNGTSDILLRHANGALAVWMQNGAATTSASIIAATDPSYAAVGSGDFNGDGRFDILFRNAGGIMAQWQLNGATVSGQTAYLTDPAWALVAIGDFNGDFRDDILFRHGPTGLLAQWQMNGLATSAVGVFAVSDTAWTLAAVADFNGDGRDDFLWRHSSGALAQWSLNGFSATNLGVFAISDTAWQIVGTGDFNGDLREDIMWRHTSGVMALWHMDGTTVTSVGTFAVSDTAWNVSDIGDYNGDGRDDILWQGPDGTFAVWAMNGFNVLSAGIVGNPGAGWTDI